MQKTGILESVSMLWTSLVIFLGTGAGGEGVLWFKEFALNFCLCLFLYFSINFCAIQYG